MAKFGLNFKSEALKNHVWNCQNLDDFFWNFGVWAVQIYVKPVYMFMITFSISVLFSQRTHVNLVDLAKRFPTCISLQKSASIQPRTSLSKFGGASIHWFIRILNGNASHLLRNLCAVWRVPSSHPWGPWHPSRPSSLQPWRKRKQTQRIEPSQRRADSCATDNRTTGPLTSSPCGWSEGKVTSTHFRSYQNES